jgi:chromosome segregation ATPase
MSTDVTQPDTDQNELRQSLAELVRAGDEFAQFVTEQFEQLASLDARLAEREREADVERGHVNGQLESLRASQQRLDEASARAEKGASDLCDLATRCAAEAQPALQDEIRALREERERLRDELGAARAQIDSLLKGVAEEAAGARAELAAAAEALVREREHLATREAPLREAIATRQAMPQAPAAASAQDPAGSSAVERPIDRQLAATTSAEEQPSDGRTTWWGELKQLRSNLGKSANRPAKGRASSPDVAAASSSDAAPIGPRAQSDDPVLDSVVAQFEMLQKELGRAPAAGCPVVK